jgi:DnaK suppressor protein
MQRKAKSKAKSKPKAGAQTIRKAAARAAPSSAARAAPISAARIAARAPVRPPKGMTSKQLQVFQAQLLDRKRGLTEAYNKNKNYGRTTEDEGTQDLADKASNAYTKEFLYSLSNTDREILQKVDDALARIATGSFGVCVECGETLNRKRLEAVPWASHCLACQEKVERGLL